MPEPSAVTDKRTDGSKRFAMSVDVEDYFQVWALSGAVRREDWDNYSLRVSDATRRVLDLFERHEAKATFFTLGWIAERAPALVREIVARGHELGSHGYDHTKVFDQDPSAFRTDVVKTKKILEDAGGVEVNGFRAAGFSIDARGARSPHVRGGIVEAPVATAEVFGRRISCAGGGWFRASPYNLSKSLIGSASASIDGPVIFYFHPWEIDAEQPSVDGLSLKSRLRHYLNLSRMEWKLERLLGDFKWGRIDEALELSKMRSAA